jgi:hypothetical protein
MNNTQTTNTDRNAQLIADQYSAYRAENNEIISLVAELWLDERGSDEIVAAVMFAEHHQICSLEFCAEMHNRKIQLDDVWDIVKQHDRANGIVHRIIKVQSMGGDTIDIITSIDEMDDGLSMRQFAIALRAADAEIANF